MTEISAKIVLASASANSPEIYTIHMRYPRFIHAELMTHRVFSRNARSSRAVPIAKMIEEIKNDPVVPLYWGKNQKGMQASEQIKDLELYYAKNFWTRARNDALQHAESMMELGLHKQIVNRILEPFMHIDTLVTATEWKNFFELRDHKDAEPHIRDLAVVVKEAMNNAKVEFLKPGQWHLPYIIGADCDAVHTAPDETLESDPDGLRKLIAISAARCARISYAPFDGDGSIERELERYNLLVGSKPMHASPVEHQATPDTPSGDDYDPWWNSELHGNFVGWVQWRKILEREMSAS
jgi:hypothetical protein